MPLQKWKRRLPGWLQTPIHAARTLFAAGAPDQAASLAYYTLLSFFPLVALAAIVFTNLLDPDTVRQQLKGYVEQYFPASEGLLTQAVDRLVNAPIATSVLAVAGLLFGVNGLLSAALRSLNRVFGVPSRPMAKAKLVQLLIGLGMAGLFLAALVVTAVFRVVTDVIVPAAQDLPFGTALAYALQQAGVLTSLLLSFTVFLLAYRMLPNREVTWRSAATGAAVAVVLFEVAKQAFFWYTAFSAQRNVIYGSLSSVILILVWANLAGMIFLYGAALTRTVMESRTARRLAPEPAD